MMLDPAPAKELPQELFALCRWVTPNETEAMFYAGGTQGSSAKVANALLNKGAKGVVLKLGEKGAAIYQTDADVVVIDPFRVSAVDTTAAGDTFNGALAAALMAGNSLAESGRIASAAAALSVTRMGAQASMPGAAEVSQFLNEIRV